MVRKSIQNITFVGFLSFSLAGQIAQWPIALGSSSNAFKRHGETPQVRDLGTKPPTVSDSLRERAAASPLSELPVVIVLSEQPVAAVRATLELRHKVRIESLQLNLAAARNSGSAELIQSAQAAEDRFVLDFRREMLAEMSRRVASSQRDLELELLRLGGRSVRTAYILNVVRVVLPAKAVAALETDPRVQELFLDEGMTHQIVNSVPMLGVLPLWNAGFRGGGQSILVLDSGINVNHPAFYNRFFTGVFLDSNSGCSLAESQSVLDYNGHGTHVAGIVGSAGTSLSPSYLGAAPLSTLFIAKISCTAGTSSFFDPLLAVQTALATTPVSIVNNSNGGPTSVDDAAYNRVIDNIVDQYDLLWVNAAGNDGPAGYTVRSPGNAYNIISVGAVNTSTSSSRSDATVASFSSRGPTIGGRLKPDIAAPGVNIYSTDYSSNGFRVMSGTSMASPHIAGAAALLKQAFGFRRLGLKALLLNSADNLAWSADTGWGFANVTRAVDEAGGLRTGSLGPQNGALDLFVGSIPSAKIFRGTAVWNRFFINGVPQLRAIDLRVFRRSDSTEMGSSMVLFGDNVQRVQIPSSPSATDVVLRVATANASLATEPFALALSESGFQRAAGILLSLQCSFPVAVVAQTQLSFPCTFSNSGDLKAFTSNSVYGWSGDPNSISISLGSLDPNSSKQQSLSLFAPANPGNYQLSVSLAGTGYGILASAAPVQSTVQVVSSSSVILSPASDSVAASGSAGRTISVSTTISNLYWTAVSQSTWINILGNSFGVGAGVVQYSVAPNSSLSARSGTIVVGGQTFTVNQAGASPSQPISVTPSTGNAGRQVFSFLARHTTSANNILYAQVLFSKSGVTAANGCYISYDPTGNVFYLLSDDVTTWFGLQGGTANTVGNSQCTIYGATSGSSKSGTDLTINADISFRTGFAGTKTSYLLAGDTTGATSAWQQVGTWSDTGDTRAVELISLTPSSGSGGSVTFTSVVKDSDGATTIPFTQFVMNAGLNGYNACFIHYDRASNAFFLLKDDASGWFGLLGGTAGQVANNQCVLKGSGSGGTASGDTLTVTYNLQFKSGFTGSRQIYLQAVDNTGVIQSWKQMGTWTVSGTTISSVGGAAQMQTTSRNEKALAEPGASVFETPSRYRVIRDGEVYRVGDEESDWTPPLGRPAKARIQHER